MDIFAILPIVMALSWSASPPEEQRDDAVVYGASVSYRESECWFWTGDVGLTARQFESDLEGKFDSKRGIVISYAANTPERCVKLAQRSAMRAGFETVRVAVRADAGAVAPPSNVH
ncbi:hypothetical protein [uncultured Sphingomonas sp.]|uniref:hypothetical protein n=1 Tax=uncultured Sphingomonas sp. TaxID=158754 RepID=UPI0025DF489B|nr:hypothetical protein [uncultured Sphingomonas sp.]